MTSPTSDDNSVLLVHAYLDGELDPANALEIAQRMSTDPALAAEGERVKALQLVHGRAVDVSSSAAERIGMIDQGVAKVKLDVVH